MAVWLAPLRRPSVSARIGLVAPSDPCPSSQRLEHRNPLESAEKCHYTPLTRRENSSGVSVPPTRHGADDSWSSLDDHQTFVSGCGRGCHHRGCEFYSTRTVDGNEPEPNRLEPIQCIWIEWQSAGGSCSCGRYKQGECVDWDGQLLGGPQPGRLTRIYGLWRQGRPASGLVIRG